MFSKVADEAPSQCFKVMSSFFALLSLLDDVIPDWDLGVRKEGRRAVTTAANPSKKWGSSVVVGLWQSEEGREQRERETGKVIR